VSTAALLAPAGQFVEAVKNSDTGEFKGLVSEKGLVFIRSFLSGNGTKGLDTRDFYNAGGIPDNLSFPMVSGGSIQLKNCFKGSIAGGVDGDSILSVSDPLLGFTDDGGSGAYVPSTESVIAELADIIINSNGASTIYDLSGQELILAEAQLQSGLPIGNFAVFVSENGGFKLRAVIDFE
jgi:hypothetical protein